MQKEESLLLAPRRRRSPILTTANKTRSATTVAERVIPWVTELPSALPSAHMKLSRGRTPEASILLKPNYGGLQYEYPGFLSHSIRILLEK